MSFFKYVYNWRFNRQATIEYLLGRDIGKVWRHGLRLDDFFVLRWFGTLEQDTFNLKDVFDTGDWRVDGQNTMNIHSRFDTIHRFHRQKITAGTGLILDGSGDVVVPRILQLVGRAWYLEGSR